MKGEREAMADLAKARENGEFDERMTGLIDSVNSNSHMYSTSCCSGRIILLAIDKPGNKKDAVFVGKWHEHVSLGEVEEVVDRFYETNDGRQELYLMAQSPIVHVVCDGLDPANDLIVRAKEAGFKYSTIKGTAENGVVVEVLASGNLQVPLGREHRLISEEYLQHLIGLGNDVLAVGWGRMDRLEGAFH